MVLNSARCNFSLHPSNEQRPRSVWSTISFLQRSFTGNRFIALISVLPEEIPISFRTNKIYNHLFVLTPGS